MIKKQIQQKILEIDNHLKTVSDLKDEYLYWDEETTKQNFIQILEGFEALLKGNKAMLKNMKK